VIWRINPSTGEKTVLVSGLRSPHGVGLDSHGDVIIADAGLNAIYRLVLPPTL
jgi:streptogramin lyase